MSKRLGPGPGQGEIFPQAPLQDAVIISMPSVVSSRSTNVDYDPTRRVSEAAADQGWGPVTIDLSDNVSDEPPVFDPEAKAESVGRHPSSRLPDALEVVVDGPREIPPNVRLMLDGVRTKLGR